MSAPIVSVVMPAWNAEHFISEAIASVYLQTFREWELIVVDDGSTDNTPHIVRKWAKIDPRILHVRLQRNSGVSTALNTGCAIASGKYIAFLGSDDIWFPRKLEESLSYLEQTKKTYCEHIVGVFHRFVVIEEQERMSNGYRIKGLDPQPFISGTLVRFEDIAYRNLRSAAPTAFFATASAIKSIGDVFNPKLSYGEDWEMLLRLTAGGAQLALLDKPLAIYRVHSSSLSATTDWKAVAYLLFQTLQLGSEHNYQLNPKKVVIRRLAGEAFRKMPFSSYISLITIMLLISTKHTLSTFVNMLRLRLHNSSITSKKELQQEVKNLLDQVRHISKEIVSS